MGSKSPTNNSTVTDYRHLPHSIQREVQTSAEDESAAETDPTERAWVESKLFWRMVSVLLFFFKSMFFLGF